MNPVAKTMIMSLLVIASGLLLIGKPEFGRPDYVSAAVPAPGPSQKKVIVKNLRMA